MRSTNLADYVNMKMYIVLHDEVPDNMAPCLAAHASLASYDRWSGDSEYLQWKVHSFKKVIVRVPQEDFLDVLRLHKSRIHVMSEAGVMRNSPSYVVVRPYFHKEDIPEVLKKAKLWSPKVFSA